MTPDQVIDMFAANSTTIDAVTKWLISTGIPKKDIVLDKTRTWINIDSTVEHMERALQTRYHVYRNTISGRDHIGADEYSLPKEIAGYIDYVHPAASLGKLNSRANPSVADRYAVQEPFRALTDAQAAGVRGNGKCNRMPHTMRKDQTTATFANILGP